MKTFPAGRMNDAPSIGLSASLAAAGFKLGRLQTGTPARLDGTTINFTAMVKQLGDVVPSPFSYLHRDVPNAVCAPVFPIGSWLTTLYRRTKWCAIRHGQLQ